MHFHMTILSLHLWDLCTLPAFVLAPPPSNLLRSSLRGYEHLLYIWSLVLFHLKQSHLLQEIAKTELKNLNNQKEHLQDEISDVKERSEKLEALYQEQEELLDKIFDGEYGSESENRLENILDQVGCESPLPVLNTTKVQFQHEQMRNRIVEANFKWRQAQLMVDYAYKQLDHAVSKWNEVSTLSERYECLSQCTSACTWTNGLCVVAFGERGAGLTLS